MSKIKFIDDIPFYEDENGERLYSLKSVCNKLGLSTHRWVAERLLPEEKRKVVISGRWAISISTPAVYSLMIRHKKGFCEHVCKKIIKEWDKDRISLIASLPYAISDNSEKMYSLKYLCKRIGIKQHRALASNIPNKDKETLVISKKKETTIPVWMVYQLMIRHLEGFEKYVCENIITEWNG